MKKIIKKIVATTVVILLVFVSGIIAIAVSPQMLFANELEHNKFSVYSSETYDENSLKIVLDDAYKLVEHSELHDPDLQFGILLAHNHFWNKIEDLRGEGVLARPLADNITIKVPINPELNEARSSRSTVNLTYLLAHEMVHVLQADKYGLLNFSPIKHPPMWKLEGYPEYIARCAQLNADAYSLRSEIQRYKELVEASDDMNVEVTEGHFMPFYYYKGRVMIEYLMDVKGMTYDEILKDDTTEELVYQEVLQWANNS